MKRIVQQVFDAQLLQRVSQVRLCMGLESLPSTISVSEIDPLLQFFLLQETDENAAVYLDMILRQDPWFALTEWEEKWKQWNQWTQWDDYNH